ncbi:endoplasmic reticulum vesicle transporter-domain-containing protein [Mycotypha africana]|uniref:endoplasmic reticulum vesicle transporter-domain-containing protein n=1 Tax=Mycotypha africana TaxID=64632 RepID=UPI002300A229|nr:endoplasmic reticulum vesicle transporter-domain-containing protein [Mycotypha africana]KAI8971707.1 endoplasmic reticulum vesicle transporter-domain-containing protein [Mycotypha africana]
MVSKSLLKRFKSLDAHAKTLDDFRVRTATGGTVTMISFVIIIVLSLFELFRYLTPTMHSEIMVDGGKQEKLPISFDITFPHLPCYMLSLDIMDESGEQISEYEHDVYKERLDSSGKPILKEKSEGRNSHQDLSNNAAQLAMENGENQPEDYCGPCYGANVAGETDPCCNTCADVQRAYADMGWSANPDNFEQCVKENWKEKTNAQSREGCRMHGTLSVNKIRGNFHFSSGRAFNQGGTHIHDMSSFLHNQFNQNFMHEIHHLQFGTHEYQAHLQKRTKLKSIINPLDKTKWGNMDAAMMYQYFLKIVASEFDFLTGKQVRTFQYSVSKQDQVVTPRGGLPGVFFMLDHSPMRVLYSETRPTLGSLLTSLCAIVGGVFSVAQIVDNILYTAEKISKQRKTM